MRTQQDPLKVLPLEQELARECWSESTELTADMLEGVSYSGPDLIREVNRRLPAECSKLTKQKLETRRSAGLVRGTYQGEGKKRKPWRYVSHDAQVNIFIELLRAKYPNERISYTLFKEYLADLEEAQNSDNLTLSTPLDTARTVFQNRLLGILLAVLGDEAEEALPSECVVGLNVISKFDTHIESRAFTEVYEIQQLLDASAWYIAVGDERSKLYIYRSLKDVIDRRRDVVGELNLHYWYRIVLIDKAEQQKYQVIIGVPRRREPLETRPLRQALDMNCRSSSFVDLAKYPGMSLLLKLAFFPPPQANPGTPLAAMCEMLASATDGWDDIAILLPRNDQSFPVTDDSLILQHSSADFLRGEFDSYHAVTLDRGIDWRRVYRNGLIVEPAVEYDPRLLFRHNPAAAAVIPIISSDETVQGLLYVIRRLSSPENAPIFTDERLAALNAVSRIFGDQILRDEVELYTINSISHRYKHGFRAFPATRFDNLSKLSDKLVELLKLDLPLEKLSQSWLYLTTLTIWHRLGDDPRYKVLFDSFCQQASLFIVDYLETQLREVPKGERLPVGLLSLDPEESQYVFPVLTPISLSEEVFKQKMRELQEELQTMGRYWLEAEIFIWGITLHFQEFSDLLRASPQLEDLHDNTRKTLMEIIEGATKAGPHINLGHRQLREGNLDRAIIEFEQAQRRSPGNWYVHKHLGEVRMLQYRMEEAERLCKDAIQLNPRYASALCLLADVLTYQGKYGEALARYEQALRYATQDKRPSYLIRYGIALANMDKQIYDRAHQEMKLIDRTILKARFQDNPALEAIERFDQAERLSSRLTQTERYGPKLRANYHYHRGMAYFRSGNPAKAIEEFSLGRKLEPDNLILADALSHAIAYKMKTEQEAIDEH